ncbi:hypothetical protein F0726_00248 [Acidithiobacillus caldus]|nr:hypothetical protein F0726_00248 [Acidithiobacillus caldus]
MSIYLISYWYYYIYLLIGGSVSVKKANISY